jgi:hypothetical protein
MNSSVGKRGGRLAYGKDGVSRRFLAALGAAVIAALFVAGPLMAAGAAWAGGPRVALPHRHAGRGDPGPASGSKGGGFGDRGRQGGWHGDEVRHHQSLAEGDQQPSSSVAGGTLAVTTAQPPDQLTATASAVPASAVPANAVAAAAAARAAATPAAARVSGSSPARVVRTSPPSRVAGPASGALAAGGLPSAFPPPQPPRDLFPTPAAEGAGGALQTARSYSLLLALAGAVVAFLAVQGRLGRRDPRIAAPRDDLDFEDFE